MIFFTNDIAAGKRQSNRDSFGLDVDILTCTAAPTSIEQLLDVGNRPPPPLSETSEPLSEAQLSKVRDIYHAVYGAGLDKFFETTWFIQRAWVHIAAEPSLIAKLALLESRFNVRAESDPEANLANQSLEGHILWEIMKLCRHVALSASSSDPKPSSESSAADAKQGVQNAARRIQIFEALITNQQLDYADSLPSPSRQESASPRTAQLPLQLEERKMKFWHHLSKFTTQRVESRSAPTDPATAHAAEQVSVADVEACLNDIRQYLDAFENRDIMYSVAIVRHYWRPGAERVPAPTSNDEADRGTKVAVARNFLLHESHSGTFQVAKVVARWVLRSWRPEGNA